MFIVRLVLFFLALLLIVIGIVAMIAPTPFGFVLVGLGFVLLAVAAPGLVRRMRQHWRWLDKALDAIAERMPKWLGREVQKSDPPEDGDEKDDKGASINA